MGQAWERTRPADCHASCRLGLRPIRIRKAAYKLTPVRKVQIVRAGREHRLHNSIVLALKWPHCMNDEIRRELNKPFFQLRGKGVEPHSAHTCSADYGRAAAGSRHHFDPDFAVECPHNPRAEIPRATQHDNAHTEAANP